MQGFNKKRKISLYLSSLGFFLDISQPPFCGSLHPFYKHFSFPYLSSWPASSQIFLEIIVTSSLGSPPIFILKHYFWGLFALFRLSYTYLMWKRLSREPLINADVTTSVILILSEGFPR